ncbi:MAG: DnaJ domain-containing protein [Caldilineaceae bacterium]
MKDRTHYQVLGIRHEASQSVIEAAYRRLKRQYESASYLERRRVGVDVAVEDARLDRIEEAYAVLRDPALRERYDASLLADDNIDEALDLVLAARRHQVEAGAWLSEQHHDEEEIRFRIGWASDFAAVRKSIEEGIPEEDRRYDAIRGEWAVDVRHGKLLGQLFDNYTPPDLPPIPRMKRPVYEPKPYTPTRYHIPELWDGWPFLVVAGLVVAIVFTMLFPGQDEQQAAAEATATAAALFELAQQANPAAFETPTPAATAVPMLATEPIYASVHLRSGPSTEANSLGYIYQGQSYWAVGRTADLSWLVIQAEDQIGWSAAWTLTTQGDVTILPSYSTLESLPTPAPTPVLAPASPTP